MTTMNDPLMERAKALKLYGLLTHWEEIGESDWIEPLIQWEEEEHASRGLQRRLNGAHLGRFKPLVSAGENPRLFAAVGKMQILHPGPQFSFDVVHQDRSG